MVNIVEIFWAGKAHPEKRRKMGIEARAARMAAENRKCYEARLRREEAARNTGESGATSQGTANRQSKGN